MIDKREGIRYTTPVGVAPWFPQIEDYEESLIRKRKELLDSQKLSPKASFPGGATES